MLKMITICYDIASGEILSWIIDSTTSKIDSFKGCIKNDRTYKLLCMSYSDGLEEKLENYKNVHVDVTREKLVFDDYRVTLKNIAWGQIEKNYRRMYSRDELNRMYNCHYVEFNLANLVELASHPESLIEIKWIKITDIQLRDGILTRPWKKFHSDPFLNKYNGNKIELAVDILENGSLWPNVTSIDYVERKLMSGETGLFSFEGNHRVPALLLAQARGLTPTNEHRVFTINFKEAEKCYYWCKLNKPEKLPYKVRQRLPIDVAFGMDYNYDPVARQKYNEIMDEVISLEKIDEYTVEINVDNWSDLVLCNQIYPHYLRDIIAYYNNQDGDLFKGHQVFSDHEFLEPWSQKYAPSFYSRKLYSKIFEYNAGSFTYDEDW